jgi:hypothetical protein
MLFFAWSVRGFALIEESRSRRQRASPALTRRDVLSAAAVDAVDIS